MIKMSKDLEVLNKKLGNLRDEVREETKRWLEEDKFLFEVVELEGKVAEELLMKYGWIDVLLLEEEVAKRLPNLMKKYGIKEYKYGSYKIEIEGEKIKIEED